MSQLPMIVSRLRIRWAGLLFASLATFSALAETHYVNIHNSDPVPPFLTWAAAATNIQDAIDAAQSGDTVLVTNGVYATGVQPGYTDTSNRVVINKPLRVRSVSGPGQTLIVGAPDPNVGGHGPRSIRCIYLGSDSVLDGFTLTNGYTRGVNPAARTPSERGGGAWCETGAVLTNCVMVGNRASDDGGGVSGGTLYRCVITANSTQDVIDGDGDGGGADRSILYRCVVSNNRGRKGGGVDECTLYACVIAGNRGRVRGGGAARSTLYQCTVVDNRSRYGGGISGCTAYNSIVYHNRAARGPNYPFPLFFHDSTFYFSCTTPLPESGSNNLTADPQLASWSHLSSSSPCRFAGSPAFVMGTVDFDGEPFEQPPCIGADQLTTEAAQSPLLVKIETDFTNVTVGFNARFKLDVNGQTTSTRWDFGDGTLLTNQLIATHIWSAPGTYLVRLTAWNDASGLAGVTATSAVNVVNAPIYFVNPANATPAFPYNSWATAAPDIQSAIAVTNTAGRIVLVTNGVYNTGAVAVWGSMMNRAALTDGVIVRSVNGPRFTFLQGAPAFGSSVGDGAIRCAYVGDGATLDGFTLTNGYTRASGHASREQGGGGAWCEQRGLVTNCVFSGNTSARDGGGANGGIFHNCVFVANVAFETGGAVDDATLNDCVLSNNASGEGNAASEAQFRHSTIVNNGGVGAVESTLRECLLTGNTDLGAAGCDLFNCVIRGNVGGAYYCSLMNCTVVGNFGTVPAVSYSRARNSIIYYNSPADTGSMYGMDHSCSSSPMGGIGNITTMPLFVDLAAGDLRLQPGSSSIDGGADLSELISTDFNGLSRPLDGNKDGVAGFDMGAFEFNPLFFTSITWSNNLVELRWYDTVAGLQLQTASSLNRAPWTGVPMIAGTNFLQLPATGGPQFFRLTLP